MMQVNEIMEELKSFGNESTKNTLMKHGAREPIFGVKVQDLKKILKKTKKNHALSLELFATGNSDAMYLAGLMADEKQISKDDLQQWVKQAYWSYLSEYAVPWVAAETPFGLELGLEWIESEKETIASAGWSTLAYYASVNSDEQLDIKIYNSLLERIEKQIHNAPNRVRYTMNGFVIAIASYIQALTKKSMSVAENIGKINVDMDGTACKVPLATSYINKIIVKGNVGKKRKTARC
ncbi:MAG: DNA alkylation repair protein [Carboxylicivirga sp.]|jgi:3-methyladenine DNA glycosylase AlkD|nr:DNA alkylation repair protein [Carboxylicivirga sp.]